jgi:hypothetical protein
LRIESNMEGLVEGKCKVKDTLVLGSGEPE